MKRRMEQAVDARSRVSIFLEHLSHLRICPEYLSIFGPINLSEVKQLKRKLRGISLEEVDENLVENWDVPRSVDYSHRRELFSLVEGSHHSTVLLAAYFYVQEVVIAES